MEVEDDERRQMFYDLVAAALTKAAQKELEAMALSENYKFQSDVAKNLIARGEGLGPASLLLRALEHRGFEVDDGLRTQILAASTKVVDCWMRRLVDGHDLQAIFRDI